MDRLVLPSVIFFIRTAAASRDQVLDLKRSQYQVLGTQAVPTSIASLFPDALPANRIGGLRVLECWSDGVMRLCVTVPQSPVRSLCTSHFALCTLHYSPTHRPTASPTYRPTDPPSHRRTAPPTEKRVLPPFSAEGEGTGVGTTNIEFSSRGGC
jgi:hypothetical protein